VWSFFLMSEILKATPFHLFSTCGGTPPHFKRQRFAAMLAAVKWRREDGRWLGGQRRSRVTCID
jgi:hypothetical protein